MVKRFSSAYFTSASIACWVSFLLGDAMTMSSAYIRMVVSSVLCLIAWTEYMCFYSLVSQRSKADIDDSNFT
jgi:hypothetical protein